MRSLTISLLASEHEGLKQLEQAISQLSTLARSVASEELEREIAEHSRAVAALHKRIQGARAELETWARKHLQSVPLTDGREMLPYELARELAKTAGRHRWFSDKLVRGTALQPSFTEEDIRALQGARRAVCSDLRYLADALPSPSDLPDEARLVALRHERQRTRVLHLAPAGNLPLLATQEPDALTRATELKNSLAAVSDLLQAVRGDHSWLRPVYEVWVERGPHAEEVAFLCDLLGPLEDVARGWQRFAREPVELPAEAVESVEFRHCVKRAAAGKRPLPLLAPGKARIKEMLRSVRVSGLEPRSPGDWVKINSYLGWCRHALRFAHSWRAPAADLDLPPAPTQPVEAVGPWALRTFQLVSRAADAATEHRAQILNELETLFPYGLDPHQALIDPTECQRAIEAIDMALTRAKLKNTSAVVEGLRVHFQRMNTPLGDKFVELLDDLDSRDDLDDDVLVERWRKLVSELDRLKACAPQFETIRRVTELIRESGAPRWATMLKTEPVDPGSTEDPWIPPSWKESWEWSCLRGYLQSIDGRDRIVELSRQLLVDEKAIGRRHRELVAARTKLELTRRLSQRVASALTQFVNAIARIGRGTGIRAKRFRRDARDAMERCYNAVPCWIMPTWRVSENLPSDLNSFDLVIFDEASQSDVTAIPALVRGRQVLIVGDDKQVSPTAAFVEEKRILQLKHNYLRDQPFGPLLLPGGSLYTLGKAMFPGQFVMLREHFRCVEPIIRFSFSFYDQPLIPLRLPTAEERIDPPLVDVYVANGVRAGRKINRPEADAIVDEAEQLVNDSRFRGRSIGIVSLLGYEQARYIQDCLLERIGEEKFSEYSITCGDSATFQGKERDIMFISMVDAPDRQSARTTREFQQRYNVALSRARDREYLYRSIRADGLSVDDLRAKTIRHFAEPMEGATTELRSLVDRCESEFEREVFSRLCDLGYRVMPQMRVGPYRIDLVVEGHDKRRVAIELDGDKPLRESPTISSGFESTLKLKPFPRKDSAESR